MASTLSELKKKAAQLPEHERAELALSLIESVLRTCLLGSVVGLGDYTFLPQRCCR